MSIKGMRLAVLHQLLAMEVQIIGQIPPGVPTTIGEQAGDLKTVLLLLAGKLNDPAPAMITLSQEHKMKAQAEADALRAQVERLLQLDQQVDAKLAMDDAGVSVVEWTANQKAKIQTHLDDAMADIVAQINQLPG